MAAKSGGGDSKQGLIITLVIFILLTLILGVTTYLGFDGQKQFLADKQKAEKDRADWEKDHDWYKFQALTYRTDMGLPLSPKEKESVDSLRDKFDKNTLTTRDPDKDSATTIIKNLDKVHGWDAANKKPGETTADKINALTRALEANAKASDELKAAFKTEQDKTNTLNKDLTAERTKNKEALEKLRAEMNGELNKYREQVADLQNSLKTQGETIAKLTADNDAAAKNNQREIIKREKANKELEAKLIRKEQDEEQQKLASAQTTGTYTRLESDKPRGEITFLNGNGQTPFINLGSADNLKTGLRFTVHGVDANGKPNLAAKGTLEVIEILKPHMAQGRLIKVVDQQSDPVLVGDKLFNPAWDPNRKTHVAISGVVDLSGNKRDGLQEFIRELNKQGIEVDSYLDLKDGEIKGEISRKTDFLILGDNFEDSNLRFARDKERLAAVNKKMKDMQETAIRNGVRPMQLREFLASTGVAAAQVDSPNYNIRSAGAPADRKNP